MIPKIISAIWMQGWNNLPEKYLPNIKSIEEKNPDYKIIKWDKKSIRDVVKYLGDQYLQKFDGFKTLHQQIDFGRYCVLYAIGGISCDLDVVAIKGFSKTPEINSSEFIVSYNSSSAFENWAKHGKSASLNNATILVSKNNPIMKGLIDHIMTLSCDINQSKESCIQDTTGPREFTKYLDQYKDQIVVLDNVYFEPCNGADLACSISPETIINHRHEGSWLSDSTKGFGRLYFKIKQNRGPIIMGLLLLFVLFIIFNKRQ